MSPTQAIAMFDHASAGVPTVIADALVAGANDAVEVLRAESPVGTGALRDAFRVEIRSDGPHIVNDEPYAGYALDAAGVDPLAAVDQAAIATNLSAGIHRLLER